MFFKFDNYIINIDHVTYLCEPTSTLEYIDYDEYWRFKAHIKIKLATNELRHSYTKKIHNRHTYHNELTKMYNQQPKGKGQSIDKRQWKEDYEMMQNHFNHTLLLDCDEIMKAYKSYKNTLFSTNKIDPKLS